MPYLKPDVVLSLLKQGGPLSRSLKGFELRPQQTDMLLKVIEAYNKGAIALIEAGTGTGKSIAYLLPALFWILENGERSVISTHTIALQEQLLSKDLPQLLRALGVEVKVALVKGMGNYLCLRKLAENMEDLLLIAEERRQQFHQLDQWRHMAHDGSRSALPFYVDPGTWEQVAAESDNCTNQKCPFYSACPFFKARKYAADAQLLVTNHSLLFADLSMRLDPAESSKSYSILPSYNRVIIDEAHHLEEVATKYLSAKTSSLELFKMLSRLGGEKGGRLPALYNKIAEKKAAAEKNGPHPLYTHYNQSLVGAWRQLAKEAQDVFDLLGGYAENHMAVKTASSGASPESKVRLLPHHVTNALWKETIMPHAMAFCDNIARYAQSVESWVKEAVEFWPEESGDQIKGLCADVTALTARLRLAASTVSCFSSSEWHHNSVRWIEQKMVANSPTVTVVNAPLDLSKTVATVLFQRFSTIVLCSATLTANHQFSYMRRRLGMIPELLPDKLVTENIYSSPFDFEKQALILIPNDMPPPSHEDFLKEACAKIKAALFASRGNAFILFTSYAMLSECFEILSEELEKKGYRLLRQGTMQRSKLLQLFVSTDRSVLFGTDSFWEGVDVAGEALRCVIIVKLPFRVPTEPIVEARVEAIRKASGDPFNEYTLPSAIIKFIQGVGRLIRHRYDRGCIVCLDNRLINKGYGRQFLNSLQKHLLFVGDTAQMSQEMENFYRKTFYLAQKQKK